VENRYPMELRRRAEQQFEVQHASTSEVSPQELRRLLAELQIQRIALDLQNEELQRARREIDAWRRRYTDLCDTAPIGYFTLGRDGLILEANPAGAGLLGLERGRLAGRRLAEFIAPDSRGRFVALLDAVFDGADRQVEDIWIQPSGRDPIPVRTEGIVAEPRRTCRIALVDLTDRQRAEAEMARRIREQEARMAAEQASAAKDRFLAVLSHELRTPLTPVLAAISMLQKREDLAADVHDTLDMARRNLELEARLIDDLLDLARISKGRMELHRSPVDVRTAVRWAIDTCRGEIESRSLQLNVELGGEPCIVDADAARVSQVVWNLLRNAAKFTPGGGHIDVRCGTDGDEAVIEVRDNGIGIEAEALDGIFDAFERGPRDTNRAYGGLGLGLSISKGLVEMHGGRLEAHSDGPGLGATFVVRLPLAEAPKPSASASPPATTARQPPSRSLCVLLVEDHDDTAEMMEIVLAAEGHRVVRAVDVAGALELASREPFDLLISDLGLPDGSGVDLMRKLRASGCLLPGIALSGFGQEKDVHHSMDAGFATHILKPVDVDRLLQIVRQVAEVDSAPKGRESQQPTARAYGD